MKQRTVGRALVAVFACAGVMLAGPAGLQAQSLQNQAAPDQVPTIDLGSVLEGFKPSEPVAEDDAQQTYTVPEYSRATATAPASVPATVPSLLLPLQMGPIGNGEVKDRIVRLSGERQRQVFYVDVPAPENATTFRLAYRISINVLPMRSQIRISVNGTEIDPIEPTAFSGFEPIDLPRNLLVAGRNEIDVTVQQSHRIFCGPEASFEIWTEFDLNESGVEIGRGDLPLDAGGFGSALMAQIATQGEVPVRIDPAMQPAILPELSDRLAGQAVGGAVLVRPQGLYDLASPKTPLARISVLSAGADTAEIRRGGDGASVLVMSPSDAGTLPNLDEFLPPAQPIGDVGVVTPGTASSLADLKFTDTTSYNRYSEQKVAFRLPQDWLVLSSQNAMLKLLYSFADGLPENALMLVKVNETTVRLLPLDRDGGDVMPLLDIGFPARLMHPGVNEISFVSIVPGDPADLPCPTFESPLLTVLDSSTLFVPTVPRMRFDGIRRPLASLRPDQVIIDAAAQTSDETMDLALKAALRPIEGVQRIDEASLHVIKADSLDKITLGELGLTRRALEEVFFDRRPSALTEPISDPSTRTWFMPALKQTVAALMQNLRDLAKPGEGPLNEWLAGKTGRAVLVVPQVEMPSALWLIVGPQADPVDVARSLAQARLSPTGPSGRFALLDADDKWSSWHDTTSPPRLEEPLTYRNFREVAGNYASWAPLYFVAALIALTVISVCLALIFVVTTRGRRKR